MKLLKKLLKPCGCLLAALLTLFLLAIAFIAFVVWAVGASSHALVRYAIETKTGYAVDYGSMSVSPFKGTFEVKNASLSRAGDPSQPLSVVFNRIFIDVDPLSFVGFSKTTLIHSLALDIDSISFSVNADGTTNLGSFLGAAQTPQLGAFPAATSGAPQTSAPQAPADAPSGVAPAAGVPSAAPAETGAWRIASLALNVRSIRVYSGGKLAGEFPVNYAQTFTNITDLASLERSVGAGFLSQMGTRALSLEKPSAQPAAPETPAAAP